MSAQVREIPCLYACSEHRQEVRELRTQGERLSVLYTVIRRGRKGVEDIGDRDSLYILYTVIRR